MLIQKLFDVSGETVWVLLRSEGDPVAILNQHEALRFAEAVLIEHEDIEQGEGPEDG
jgi:hypothetical protein